MKEPKIRFMEFKGEWEDHTLGDFGHISMCKRIFKNQTSPDGDIPFFKIGTFGYTPDAYISRKLYEEYRQLYPFPHKGDILISAAGTIGRTVEYMGEDAYYQDSNIVWLNHSNEIDNKFLKYLYSQTNWNNLEGATIKRLYNSILLSTKSNCPSLAEQQSIASFFTTLDAQISASTSRLASLKQIKAASLQAMFPQEGETVPKLRFKGFEGEWEEITLGEIAPLVGGYAFKSANFEKTGIPIVRISNILDSGVVGGDFAKYKCFEGDSSFRLYDGDTVIAMSGATTGKVAVVKTHTFLYQNQRVGKFSRTDKIFYTFVSIFVGSKKFANALDRKLTASAQPNASSKDIDSIKLSFPSSKDEQRAIASYFTNLDRQITLQSQRLEKLKQIKAACLDKMFV